MYLDRTKLFTCGCSWKYYPWVKPIPVKLLTCSVLLGSDAVS